MSMNWMYPYVMSAFYDNMLHSLDDFVINLTIDLCVSNVNVHSVNCLFAL